MVRPDPVLIGALLVFIALTATGLTWTFIENEGRFVYALDDAYIHLSVARSFASTGTWGISADEFTASCSSLLWPLLLAPFTRVAGGEWAPLALNILLAMGLLYWIARTLPRSTSRSLKAAVLIGAVVAVPFMPMLFSGMEHLAQTLSVLICAELALRLLASAKPTPRDWIFVALALVVATSIRYEGLFLGFAIACALLAQRRWLAAVLVGAIAWIPPLLHGWVAMHHGWDFLPAGLLLKSRPFLEQLSRLVREPHLPFAIALVGTLLIARRRIDLRDTTSLRLFLFVITATAHALFSGVGWFYRYEAYLIAWLLFLTPFVLEAARSLPTVLPKRALQGMAVALIATLGWRSVHAHWDTPRAMNDRLVGHGTIAQFLDHAYAGEAVVVNDIGMVSYHTRCRILDCYGLSSLAIFREKRGDGLTPSEVDHWARDEGASIAVLQIEWTAVTDILPPNWRLVATWTLPRNVVFSDREVGFFAIDDASVPGLRQALERFAPQRPQSIEETVLLPIELGAGRFRPGPCKVTAER